MSTDMVKQVMLAIHTLRHSTKEQQAIAAIEAMRRATQPMIERGAQMCGTNTLRMMAAWDYMIDKALEDHLE